jgi:hypothetical protein
MSSANAGLVRVTIDGDISEVAGHHGRGGSCNKRRAHHAHVGERPVARAAVWHGRLPGMPCHGRRARPRTRVPDRLPGRADH